MDYFWPYLLQNIAQNRASEFKIDYGHEYKVLLTYIEILLEAFNILTLNHTFYVPQIQIRFISISKRSE